MFENIRADLDRKMRGYGVRAARSEFLSVSVSHHYSNSERFAVIVHRFGRWVYKIKIPVIRQLMIFIYLVVNIVCLAITGIHVHRESEIGPGLVIHNSNCIFILATKIGHSCTVNQGVSVASVRGTGWPTLGNNVYLGAGCKVMGGITVGDNVVVSANSL